VLKLLLTDLVDNPCPRVQTMDDSHNTGPLRAPGYGKLGRAGDACRLGHGMLALFG